MALTWSCPARGVSIERTEYQAHPGAAPIFSGTERVEPGIDGIDPDIASRTEPQVTTSWNRALYTDRANALPDFTPNVRRVAALLFESSARRR